jgi:CRISPR-associated exonuclease Cas4
MSIAKETDRMKQEREGLDEGIESVMISALEHYSYCPRQCALIHIEQTFDENIYTLRGNLAHERVDQTISRNEDEMRVERGLSLWSKQLGLTGRADIVEFHDEIPYPVEYKQGQRRDWQYEAIQLCAQALCLEEMLGLPVPKGAIYYCSSRVRREIILDETLRVTVQQVTQEVRALLAGKTLPAAVNDQRCKKCSLIDSCLPQVMIKANHFQWYLTQLFQVDGQGEE